MSSLQDVITTIAQNIVAPIYPNGTSDPSIISKDVSIITGWPVRNVLDSTLQAGNAQVSVYPTNHERVVTKFERNFLPLTETDATIIATVNIIAGTVTLTGSVTIPEALTIVVDGIGYSYQVVMGDTLDTIATNTAAIIPNATALANVITITGADSIISRIATPYSAAAELCRVDRMIMITSWASNPTDRTTLEAAIDVFMKENYRMTMPDGFIAQVFYHKTDWTDMLEKSLIYRSDLIYTIQYATTIENIYTTITYPFVNSVEYIH